MVRRWLAMVGILGFAGMCLGVDNVAPTPTVTSAVQRSGTTYMDIDFRVDDPDDATVEVAALGFVNGGTSFSDIIRITTLVEGTATNLGVNVPANTNLRLTWNVGADWNTNFGSVQVEIYAKDRRGLMPFHWITVPGGGTNPAVEINSRPISDADLAPVWLWLIANGEPGIRLVGGQVIGNGGDCDLQPLATNSETFAVGREFLWKRLDIHSVTGGELARAKNGRFGFHTLDPFSIAKTWRTHDRIYGWEVQPGTFINESPIPRVNCPDITAVAVGGAFTLLVSGGGVIEWCSHSDAPPTATNVVAVAAGSHRRLALRSDGTVVGWGGGESPDGLTNVIAIAAGKSHCLALRSDGRVVGWGDNDCGQITIPTNATNLIAIAATARNSMGLRADGTMIQWGNPPFYGPIDLTGVVAIAGGGSDNFLALLRDGTLWDCGSFMSGRGVRASNVVAMGGFEFGYQVFLRSDGTVWPEGMIPLPSSIDLIGVGVAGMHVVVVDKRGP